MRAIAVFPERRELRMVDLPAPQSNCEHDVTVRVREVGICGTDREISGFHYGTPPSGLARLVLGHEALGEVVSVGPAVRTLSSGDLVAFAVRPPCERPTCVACRAGRQDFCISGEFRERGIKEANGVFIFSGVPGASKPIEIDLDGIMRNLVLENQVLFGTVNASRAAFEASVRQLEQLMALFPTAVRSLVTKRARLEDAPALRQRAGGIKQVVALAA